MLRTIVFLILVSINLFRCFSSFGQDHSLEMNKNSTRVRLDGPGSKAISPSDAMTFIFFHEDKKLKIPENGNIEDSVAMNVINMINPEWIQSMEILKGQEAAKFDSINTNGVMLIQLKNDSFKKMPRQLRRKFY